MTIVDFGTQQNRAVGTQYVYLRQRWNDAWSWVPSVHCSMATWCLSPSMPTAILDYDYGVVKAASDRIYSVAQQLDVNGWYVKVVMETNTLAGEYSTWYGVVEHVEDEHGGIVSYQGQGVASGRQRLHCYGLERLLDKEYISESYVDIGEVQPLVVQLPIAFNARGLPNRNDRKHPPQDHYVFEGRDLNPGGTLRPTAQWWSTDDIVRYLIAWMVPKESFRTRQSRLNWVVHDPYTYLPYRDRPVLAQEGMTVFGLLNRLIDRRRLRSFRVTVDETATPHEIRLEVVAWNKADIFLDIDGADYYARNEDTVNLLYDFNQSTTAVLRKTKVSRYDRIVVRGARRTSTATFVVDDTVLKPAWSSDAETAYEAAASGVTGYVGWDALTQLQRNAEVRDSDELSHVFSWFKVPDTWTGTVIDAISSTTYDAFLDDDGNAAKQNIHEVFFESQLPLYEKVDYSGDAIGDGTVADPPLFVYRQPLLLFKVPTDGRYLAGDAISTLAETSVDPEDAADGRNFRWSSLCRVQPDSRTLEVRVSGEQQHVIASTDFTPLSEDRDLGDFDYRSKNMLITAALRENRYAEGKYPDDGSGDSTLIDQQFGYVIYAGDDFRLDYVVPGTVVDVAAEGTVVTANGGYVRDDRPLLNALARVAYEWWHQERIVLTLSTTQLTSSIQVGTLILTIGDPTVIAVLPAVGSVLNEHYQEVNTVVSELRITWPRLEGNQRDMPTLQFTTGAGELDPMQMMPPRQKIVSRAQARRARR